MSDLTDHQRKAGRTVTPKKTAASRATIAEARKAKESKRELRARYVAALERVSDLLDDGRTCLNDIYNANRKARALRAELGGKR